MTSKPSFITASASADASASGYVAASRGGSLLERTRWNDTPLATSGSLAGGSAAKNRTWCPRAARRQPTSVATMPLPPRVGKQATAIRCGVIEGTGGPGAGRERKGEGQTQRETSWIPGSREP